MSCKRCGFCPSCGRGGYNYPYMPHNPYYPYWTYPYTNTNPYNQSTIGTYSNSSFLKQYGLADALGGLSQAVQGSQQSGLATSYNAQTTID